MAADCDLAYGLWEDGYEIATHTRDHARLANGVPKTVTVEQILGAKTFLSQQCGIPAAEIRGFRNPYRELGMACSGNGGGSALAGLGSRGDSAMGCQPVEVGQRPRQFPKPPTMCCHPSLHPPCSVHQPRRASGVLQPSLHARGMPARGLTTGLLQGCHTRRPRIPSSLSPLIPGQVLFENGFLYDSTLLEAATSESISTSMEQRAWPCEQLPSWHGGGTSTCTEQTMAVPCTVGEPQQQMAWSSAAASVACLRRAQPRPQNLPSSLKQRMAPSVAYRHL